MNHDIFLCYDERDSETAAMIYRLFNENGMNCWFKPKHPGTSGEELLHAIDSSKAVVFIHSKNSYSDSVVREINRAFSNVEILRFNIDSTSLTGSLEYYLKNHHSLNAYPNTAGQLKKLVEDASKAVSKPAGDVVISKDIRKYFKRFESSDFRILKYVKIAVPVLVVLVLVVYFVVLPSGMHTTQDGEFVVNVSSVEVENLNGQYVYTVLGNAYNMPDDSEIYLMHFKFYDNENNLVYDVNSTCDEIKGHVLTTFSRENSNITELEFELEDFSDNKIFTQTCRIG